MRILFMLPVVCLFLSCQSQESAQRQVVDGEDRLGHGSFTHDTGYTAFGVEGGYECGSVVQIEPSTGEMIPIISLDDWYGLDPLNKNFVERTYAYRDDFLGSVRAGYQGVAGADAFLESITRVDFTIERAHRCIITEAALLQHLTGMGESERSVILDILSKERDGIVLLSEVLIVSNGTLEVYFSDSAGASIEVDVIEDLFSAKVDMIEAEKATLRYSKPIEIGYKTSDTTIDLVVAKLNHVSFYRDLDGDGLGGSERVWAPRDLLGKGYSDRTGDCVDSDSLVYPGQTSWFSSPNNAGNYDYNCDGSESLQYVNRGSCRTGCGEANQGWYKTNVPACGVSAKWLDDCDFKPFRGGCIKETSIRRQECR